MRAGEPRPGPPAHTPTGPRAARDPGAAAAKQSDARPEQKVSNKKPERRNAQVSGLNSRQEHAPGKPLDNQLGFSAEKAERRGPGRKRRPATHTHTRTLTFSHTRLLFLVGRRVQVRATQQPHARTRRGRATEADASAPPGKRPRPPGQRGAQGGCARSPTPPPPHPAHGHLGPGGPGMLGGPAAGSHAPLPRPPAPPPGPPAGRAGGERRRPGGSALGRGWEIRATFPSVVAGCLGPYGGRGPGSSATWTHFFGCFSLFGLRFRA